MGLGRRQFLKFLGAALTSSLAETSRAVVVIDDHYVNRKLGIAFTKPSGWLFADVCHMGQVKQGQILDVDDPDLAREIIDASETPVLTITKFGLSEKSNQFTPGVLVFLNQWSPNDRDKNPAAIRGLEATWQMDADTCHNLLKDFEIVEPPVSFEVSGCSALRYESSFLFEHANMKPTPVRMRTLVIDQGPALYTLRMYDSPHLGGSLVHNYDPFVKSIKMV